MRHELLSLGQVEGESLCLKLGDAAGATCLKVLDSAGVAQMCLDSNGVFCTAGAAKFTSFTGNLAIPAAGTVTFDTGATDVVFTVTGGCLIVTGLPTSAPGTAGALYWCNCVLMKV